MRQSVKPLLISIPQAIVCIWVFYGKGNRNVCLQQSVRQTPGYYLTAGVMVVTTILG